MLDLNLCLAPDVFQKEVVRGMQYWIFKVADQEPYPDVFGKEYVFDNTHCVQVRAGDAFLYFDKRQGHAFTATGMVGRLRQRPPPEGKVAYHEG